MQMMSLPLIGLFIIGVLIQVLTYRKEKSVKPRRIIISQSAAFLSMVVFSLVTLRPPGPIWWFVLLSLGFGGGIVYGGFVNVRAGARGVTMAYTLPWLLTWGALMTLTQLSSVFFRSVPVLIYGLAILNLGINIGMNTRILLGYRTVAGLATAGLAVALLIAMPVDARAEQQYDTGLPEVMNGEVDGLSVQVLSAGGISGDCVSTVFQNDLGETVVVLIPIGTRLMPETSKTQIMVTAGNELLEVTPGSSSFPIKGFCSLHAASSPQYGKSFSFYEMADDEVIEVLRNINRAGAFNGVGQQAVWCVTDGGDPETMDPAARELVPRGFDGRPTNTVEDYQAVGSDYDPTVRTMDPSDPTPLNPIQAGTAVGLSSLILTLGSMLQLTDKFDPAGMLDALKDLSADISGGIAAPPAEMVPDPLSGLPQSEDGRVFMRVPWDEAGEAWVTRDEAEQTMTMQSQGYRWDKRWGWVTDQERADYEAVNEASRAYNRQQDPELALLTEQIRAERERDAANVEYWRQAQIDAQRAWVRRSEIRSNEDTSEALAWDVTAADLAYYPVAAVGLAADMAVSGIATVATFTPVGPLAHALRAGYNMAKGVGTSVGEVAAGVQEVDPTSIEIDPETGKVIAEKLRYTTRRSYNGSDLVRGVGYGVENNVWDFAVDASVRKVIGEPQLWKALASPPKVPAPLLVPKAAARQLLEGVEDTAAKEGVDAAAAKIGADKVNLLFKNVGRKNLGQLESYGQLSRNEVAVINRVVDQQVEKATQTAVSETAKSWDSAATGVKLERIILGDSGSSTGRQLGKVRSVMGDHDKTLGGIFNTEDIAKVAKATGRTEADVYAELNKKLTQDCSERISANMPKNLSAEAADVKLYSGMGESAGQADDYARGFTRLRSDVQGVGTSTNAAGVTHNISGRQVVDEIDLMGSRVGAPAQLGEAAFPVREFPQVASRQIQSLSKEAVDPRTAAKAFDRLATMAERGTMARAGATVDPKLAKIAREILSSPQPEAGNVAKSTMALLQRNGYSSQEQFAQALLGEGQRVAGDIQRIVPKLGK